MDSEPRNIDLWMQENLNSWAEHGNLSLDRSTQLHMRIANLAHQERKNRFTRKASGLVAAIISFLWLLFANCPVAAASYVGSSIHSNHFPEVKVIGLLAILICFFIKHQFQAQTTNSNFEVNYE